MFWNARVGMAVHQTHCHSLPLLILLYTLSLLGTSSCHVSTCLHELIFRYGVQRCLCPLLTLLTIFLLSFRSASFSLHVSACLHILILLSSPFLCYCDSFHWRHLKPLSLPLDEANALFKGQVRGGFPIGDYAVGEPLIH